jgi:predicted dehydrogenase
MKKALLVALAALTIASEKAPEFQGTPAMAEVKFMTLDPGHFHAGLVQKEMYKGVSKRVDIYAPFGQDLIEHLNRIKAFNTRKENPTSWELEIHTGPDFFERMRRDKPGNVVVLSGRNNVKIDRIKASIESGLHVLADKPWIIEPASLPKLQAALDTAEKKGLIAYDIMTERYEITSLLQQELVNDAATFGTIVAGTEKDPGVYIESIHFLMKLVAGLPNRRPAWFFDVNQQGEALTDVGTHLVDLVPWMLFPEQPIDYRKDIKVLSARRWPTIMSLADFQKVTGETAFPDFLAPNIKNNKLEYYCNTAVNYVLRGINVKFDVLWNYETPEGGDTHFAVFKGSRARVEIRQRKPEKYRPELYIVPNTAAEKPAVFEAAKKLFARLQTKYPGVAVEDGGKELRVTIPEQYRVGHEAHFAQVTEKFLKFLKNPKSVPAWEKPNMLAKYYVTTRGLELSRQEKR